MNWVQKLGPGLLYAGAAIGVSHIVQSTKAGAIYGYVLITGILLAHLFKYPFFEMGPRFAIATGESLISGFRKLGNWAVWVVLILTVTTMFAIQGAVTAVTAGIANKLFGLEQEEWITSAMLLFACAGILILGRFNVLDRLMKVVMLTLAVTTVLAVIASFFSTIPKDPAFFRSMNLVSGSGDIGFLIAFIGWMPAPLDIAIWHSLWSIEALKSREISLRNSLFDFKVGYWGTAFLALCFLILGANVIYGTGIELAANGTVYAGQLIDIYTNSLGKWSYYIIGVAAFTTMFSTTLTCLDAQPRVLAAIYPLMRRKRTTEGSEVNGNSDDFVYQVFLGALIIGTIVVLSSFVSSMKQIVTTATTISFLTAPVIGFLCLRVARQLPDGFAVSKKMMALGWTGVVFLTVFSLYYLWVTMI